VLCGCGCGEDAGQSVWKTKPRKFVDGHQSRRSHKERYMLRGMWYVWKPGHSKATSRGFVPEHVLLAEFALGHPLPRGVDIHHADGDRSNNIGNLVICQNREYHALLHVRMRALQSCGRPSWRKCPFCKKYDSQENLVPRKDSPTSMVHLACRRLHSRDYGRGCRLLFKLARGQDGIVETIREG